LASPRASGVAGVDVWMPADDLERVDGEDYRRVPKRFADDSPF
jgi:hypothetical protein